MKTDNSLAQGPDFFSDFLDIRKADSYMLFTSVRKRKGNETKKKRFVQRVKTIRALGNTGSLPSLSSLGRRKFVIDVTATIRMFTMWRTSRFLFLGLHNHKKGEELKLPLKIPFPCSSQHRKGCLKSILLSKTCLSTNVQIVQIQSYVG